MPLQQRVLLVICAAFLFVYVVRRIRKKKLQIADAVFWVLFLLLVLLMAVVPEITFLCAALLGFSSPSYFSQSFRRAEGMSPMEYRRSHASGDAVGRG